MNENKAREIAEVFQGMKLHEWKHLKIMVDKQFEIESVKVELKNKETLIKGLQG